MIDSLFKRVIAYLIDMMLVSIVVNSIISSNVVNFQLNKYNKLYDEYYDIYTLHLEQTVNKIESCGDLEKAIKDKKLTEEKFVSSYNSLKESYSKQEISDEDYDNKCLIIVKDYNSNKMTDEYYSEKVDYYYYRLEKNSIVVYAVNIIAFMLYFVFFQGFTGGQTLGKKITRLKVVSTKEDEKLSYKQLFKRTLFLPINTMFSSVTYCIIMLGCILVLPENLFTPVTDFLYFINYMVILGIVFTISFNKGKIGLHDMVAHTRIMEMDFKGNEIKKDNKNKKVVKEEKVIQEEAKTTDKIKKRKSKDSKK
ncbi:MAG: RDD family protein [Firmicutes bacterium]|nr:RDD family protein [Bacillota bacterium]